MPGQRAKRFILDPMLYSVGDEVPRLLQVFCEVANIPQDFPLRIRTALLTPAITECEKQNAVINGSSENCTFGKFLPALYAATLAMKLEQVRHVNKSDGGTLTTTGRCIQRRVALILSLFLLSKIFPQATP